MTFAKKIHVIAFDADDTLWVNEPFFQEKEKEFSLLVSEYSDLKKTSQELFKMEMANLELYGYGIKGFVLSMIETALKISNNRISQEKILQIIDLGKDLLNKPIHLLEGVEEVLRGLQGKFKVVLATKGDLLDQERKLKQSNLEPFFHHVEIMSDKTENEYRKLINHLEIEPEQFLMIGNSVKSDILPVIKIGGSAIHVPFQTTWAHEIVKDGTEKVQFTTIQTIREVLGILS